MHRNDTLLSLDELSDEIAGQLEQRGLLGAAPDARVSAAPDARTVRYYTTLGLIDRPAIVGREARYGRRHVRQLLAIKGLQAASLPLAEIQQRLYGRSDAELDALVDSLGRALGVKAAQARKPEAMALSLRELTIEPGLRLLVEEGYRPREPSKLETRIREAVAALSHDPSLAERGPNRGGSA